MPKALFLFHNNIGGSPAISSGTDINNCKQAILTSPPLQLISITSDGWLVGEVFVPLFL